MFAPRLAGRLSTDLILRSPQYMNACDEYEIDLRGNKIGAIENLGGTENQFDSIDLSDNDIVKLEGFPLLPRLKTLTLNHNRVSRISKNLATSIPNLETLVLTGNRINSIADLENLRCLTKLKRLVVVDNGVSKIPDYRLRIIKALPQVKMVDFTRVTERDREAAMADAGLAGGSAPTAGAEAEAPQPEQREKPNLVAIKAALASAQTIEEVQKLEAALQASAS